MFWHLGTAVFGRRRRRIAIGLATGGRAAKALLACAALACAALARSSPALALDLGSIDVHCATAGHATKPQTHAVPAIAKRDRDGPGGKRSYPKTHVQVAVQRGDLPDRVLRTVRGRLRYPLRSCADKWDHVTGRFVLALEIDKAGRVARTMVVQGGDDERRVGKCVADRARRAAGRVGGGPGVILVTGHVEPR